MKFGLSVAKFLAQHPTSRPKFDLSKSKIQVAQLSDFILFPFLTETIAG